MFGMIGQNPKIKKNSSGIAWPIGADGNLLINGTTFTLDATAAAITRDYNNITIINGGILDILGGNWASIGYAGILTIDATSMIRVKSNTDAIAEGTTQTYTATAPDGTLLGAGTTQTAGGAGGTAPSGA